jgi:hypothetical protein
MGKSRTRKTRLEAIIKATVALEPGEQQRSW